MNKYNFDIRDGEFMDIDIACSIPLFRQLYLDLCDLDPAYMREGTRFLRDSMEEYIRDMES